MANTSTTARMSAAIAGPEHAPEPAQHHDHERLEELARAEGRVEGEEVAESSPASARQRRADAEGEGVDALDVDADQRAAVRVLRHGADGAAEVGARQEEVEQHRRDHGDGEHRQPVHRDERAEGGRARVE